MLAFWLSDTIEDAGDGVINAELAATVAVAALLLVLWLLHVLLKQPASDLPADPEERRVAERRNGIKSLVIGTDGRASTSKLQAVLWTFAVLFVFLFLLLWGRSTDCGSEKVRSAACIEAQEGRDAFNRLVNTELQPEYYVLLGFPITAAVAAKALTTSKVKDGTLKKPELPAGEAGPLQAAGEIVANDHGQADLLDAQYFAFTVLTLAFFFFEFFTHPGNGLPDLPETLIALSGFSVAAYTAKKALETSPPDAAAAPAVVPTSDTEDEQ